MLLQRLVEYASANCVTKSFHTEREFIWQLELSSKHGSAQLVDLRGLNDRGKVSGQRRTTPSVTRTVGVAPQLGADDVQYVLGWGDETTRPDRVRQCHTEFVALISRWAESVSDSGSVAHVLGDFYAAGGVDQLDRPPDITAKQGVLITVDGELIAENDSLIRFWGDEVARRKGGGTTGLCLVCGHEAILLKTVPGNIAKRLVPGAANNAALVSINERVFGYGLSKGLEHTPICFACGDAMNTALTALLSGPHVLRLQQQDSAMTWWTLGRPTDDFFAMMQDRPDPDAVARLLSRLHSGALAKAAAMASAVSGDRFCSVTLGGNSSRVVVRDWIDLPLQQVLHNLARWHDDHRIHTVSDPEPKSYGLLTLVMATGRWDQTRNCYPDLGSTSAGRPEHIYRDLLCASLRGTPQSPAPLPPVVLHHLIHRVTSDGRVDGPRAALLRLALNRHPRKENRMPPHLDESSEDAAYVAGQVFALYDRIQYAASSGKNADGEFEELNTTFADRFFPGAISNPRPALLAGRRLTQAWIAKIRRKPKKGWLAHALGEELDQLLKKLEVFPGYLSPVQQARFVLGYHHQRARYSDERRARQDEKTA